TAHRACLSHDIVSGDPHSAGSEAKRRGKNRDRGRLSGPVWTEEREELPLLHVEADTIDGVRTALSIPLDKVANLNRGRHSFRPSLSVRHARSRQARDQATRLVGPAAVPQRGCCDI